MSKPTTDLTQQEIPEHVDQSDRTLLVDADSIAFILGWHLKDIATDDYMQVVKTTDDFMHQMMANSGAVRYIGFLGGVHPTFRHMLDATYKANRGQTKPDWHMLWGSIVNHRLRHKWKFHYVEGIEAEDAVGMLAKHLGYAKVIIAGIDKDLDQIPGIHYNYAKQRKYFVHGHSASRKIYELMLVGDRSDNYPGVPGIGPVNAAKILFTGDIHSNPDLMVKSWAEATLIAYQKSYGPVEGADKYNACYHLTKILEDPETHGFKFPVEQYIPIEYVTPQNVVDNTQLGISDGNTTPVQNLFE